MSEPPRRGGPGDARLAETLLVVDDEVDVRALARDVQVSLETGDPQHALRLAKVQLTVDPVDGAAL